MYGRSSSVLVKTDRRFMMLLSNGVVKVARRAVHITSAFGRPFFCWLRDAVLRAGVTSGTVPLESVLRSSEASLDWVLRAGEACATMARDESAMMTLSSVAPVIHWKTQAVMRIGLRLMIYNWGDHDDGDDDDDDDDDDDSAVELVPLENSQRLFSFLTVEDGHLLWQTD